MKAIPIRVPSLAVEDPAYFLLLCLVLILILVFFFDVTYMYFERDIRWVQ
jgi:hypothetical protein